MPTFPKKLQNFVGGKFQPSKHELHIESRNPSTGIVESLVPDSDEQDVEDAVRAAQDAFSE